MTGDGRSGRAVSDPVGLVTELVTAVERELPPEQVRVVVTAVAGGRAKSRRLAAALEERPAVLGYSKGRFMIAIGLWPGALGGTRTPNLLIRRSMERVRSQRRNPYRRVSVLPGLRHRCHSPVPSGQSVRKL